MGTHIHVLVESNREVGCEVAWLARSLRRMKGWPAPDVAAKVAVGRSKVLRDIRYIAVNPCEARLCSDPLQWLWSTHRELFGAAVDPWLDPRVRRLMGGPEALHRYVSGHPSVRVEGTPPPRVAGPAPIATRPISDIAHAVLAAWRMPNGALRQRGPARTDFLRLAWEQGWRDAAMLANLVGVRPQAVRGAWSGPPTPAARSCLGDARLLARIEPPVPKRLKTPFQTI